MIRLRSICLLYAVIQLLVLKACREASDDKSIPVIPISKGDIVYEMPTSIDSVFSVNDYICLETTQEALLGRLSKIEVYKDNFYIEDETGGRRLMLFTNRGKFITQIGKQGKSPQEYIDLTDFTIDRVANQILILCAPSKSILAYSLQGQFIKRINLQIKNNLFGPNRIGASDGYYYLESIGIYPNLAIFDNKGNLIGQHFINEKGLVHLILPLTFSSRGVVYHKPFNDTIYSLEKDKLSPLFYINYGKFRIDYPTFEKVGTPNPVYPSYREMPEEYCELDEVFLMKQIMALVTVTDGEHLLSMISTNTLSVKTYKLVDFKQLLGVSLNTPKASDEDGYLYSYYYPHQLIGLINPYNNGRLNEAMTTNCIEESSNPVIVKYILN